MTDNEKRAHDIALKYADIIVKAQITNQKLASAVKIPEVKVDYYAEYKKAYQAVLEQINKDFS